MFCLYINNERHNRPILSLTIIIDGRNIASRHSATQHTPIQTGGERRTALFGSSQARQTIALENCKLTLREMK